MRIVKSPLERNPSNTYILTLKVAREELYTLSKQQDENSRRMSQLRHTIVQIERLTGEVPTILGPKSISRACHEILQSISEPLSVSM